MHVPYPGLPKRESIRPEPRPDRQARIIPTFIEHFRDDSGQSDPYDRLYQARIIFLATPLDDATANDVIARLFDLDAHERGREITLQINSAGGSFPSVLAVHDAIQHVAAPVRTVCLGQADGPAAVLLALGAPGRRFVLPTAHVMLREPTIEQPGTERPDVEAELERANWLRRTIEDLMAERIGRPGEEIRRDLARPKLFTAQQAIDYGIADAVLPARH